jgi:hypothetical protein
MVTLVQARKVIECRARTVEGRRAVDENGRQIFQRKRWRTCFDGWGDARKQQSLHSRRKDAGQRLGEIDRRAAHSCLRMQAKRGKLAIAGKQAGAIVWDTC